jgi:hypothetical protein
LIGPINFDHVIYQAAFLHADLRGRRMIRVTILAEGVPTAAFPEARQWDECVLLGKFTSLYTVNFIPEVSVFVDFLCFFRSHIHSHFLKDSLNDRANVSFRHEGHDQACKLVCLMSDMSLSPCLSCLSFLGFERVILWIGGLSVDRISSETRDR